MRTPLVTASQPTNSATRGIARRFIPAHTQAVPNCFRLHPYSEKNSVGTPAAKVMLERRKPDKSPYCCEPFALEGVQPAQRRKKQTRLVQCHFAAFLRLVPGLQYPMARWSFRRQKSRPRAFALLRPRF